MLILFSLGNYVFLNKLWVPLTFISSIKRLYSYRVLCWFLFFPWFYKLWESVSRTRFKQRTWVQYHIYTKENLSCLQAADIVGICSWNYGDDFKFFLKDYNRWDYNLKITAYSSCCNCRAKATNKRPKTFLVSIIDIDLHSIGILRMHLKCKTAIYLLHLKWQFLY